MKGHQCPQCGGEVRSTGFELTVECNSCSRGHHIHVARIAYLEKRERDLLGELKQANIRADGWEEMKDEVERLTAERDALAKRLQWLIARDTIGEPVNGVHHYSLHEDDIAEIRQLLAAEAKGGEC